jgi:hypothetical protein
VMGILTCPPPFPGCITLHRVPYIICSTVPINGYAVFLQEGHNCEKFQALYGSMPRVRTPAIKWPYTSRRVLVMEWIDGVKLTNKPVSLFGIGSG